MGIKSFTDTYYPMAKHAGATYNLHPLYILAQAAVESGWGRSLNAAAPNNNFFGITATKSWNGRTRLAKTGLRFRCYPTAQESFDDFGRLISRKYTLAAAAKTLEEYARLISRSAYISESNGDNRGLYQRNICWAGEKIAAVLPQL